MGNVLEARHIVKQYPGTVALDDVSVSFDSGRIHALIGKNGSGKSTLLKIFSGAEKKTSGTVSLGGKQLDIKTPSEAFQMGIATVYQEMSLIPELSVAENICIGNLPSKGIIVDWKATRARAASLLKELEIEIDPDALVSDLSVGERQMVEIAKAINFDPLVLQLDEPTSAVTQAEVQTIFKLVKRLKDRGLIIIYVSHRLHELWEIADTCTVLRDGKLIGVRDMQQLSRPELVHMMFGDVEINSRPADLTVEEEVVLEVKHLSCKHKFSDVSFQLKKGEILGIAGMLGSGRTELLQAIFGAAPFDSGEIYVSSKKVEHPTPNAMKKLGVTYTPEDRQEQGLIDIHSIESNLTLASYSMLGKHITLENKALSRLSNKLIHDLQIKLASSSDPVSSLSGGNQQKIVVGNWIGTNPKIMMFDEPSRGIDVSAKQQIFQIMWDQSRKGISSIMVSTELEELLEVCHRILIIKGGQIIGEVKNPETVTVEQLYTMSMGGTADE